MKKEKFICRTPGKRSIKLIHRDKKVVSQCLGRDYDFVYKKAKGCYVWDEDNRKYLDFEAGVAVMNVGHTNPDVVKAIKEQLKYGLNFTFADFRSKLPIEFVEELLKYVPKKLDMAFLSNSGTESVEAAMKLARWNTQKKWFIAFKPCFHGRTFGSLSLTNSSPVQREGFGPFLHVKHAPYPYIYRHKYGPDVKKVVNDCLEQLEKTIKSCKGDVAAIFMEPVSGEGGYIVPPTSWVKGVRKLCNKYDILLVADEVQSGCNRTGKFLAISHHGVTPDIVCISKAVAGGVPLGVTIANHSLMKWPPGAHANTFGGNLLACAAGIATLKYMKKHKLAKNATTVGKYMLDRLKKMQPEYDVVGDVRGLGLMVGVEIVKDKKSKKPGSLERHQTLCTAMSKGLLTIPASTSTIRICPPLIITKKQAKLGLDILEESFPTG